MIKKTITFPDLDGNELTEDFYFHLTKADLARMQLVNIQDGGMEAIINKIVETNDGKTIIELFEQILHQAYGKRSPDGKRFIRTDELSNEFKQTEAYSVLFMELVTNSPAAAEFISGLVPSDLAEKVPQMAAANTKLQDRLQEQKDKRDARPKNPRMTKEEILAGMRAKSQNVVLTYNDILNMSQNELDANLAAGATIAED